MIQIPKFIKDTLKYFQYEGSPNPTTQDDLQAFMKSDHSVLECLVDGLWQPETYYKENHIVRSPNMPAGYTARCTTAGSSGTNEPDWGTATVTDGSAKWKMQKQGSGSGGGATWESSTFYNVDSTVSLEGNSSFFLLCVKSGTSGATQPTVSSEANVTDGSVTWKPVYYKKLPTLDSSNYIKGENLAGYWKASQSVTVGTIRFLQGDKYAGYYLRCTTAGTTGTTQPTTTPPAIDGVTNSISDGTVKWSMYGMLYALKLEGKSVATIKTEIQALIPSVPSHVKVVVGSVNLVYKYERIAYTLTGTIPLPSGYSRSNCTYFIESGIEYLYGSDSESSTLRLSRADYVTQSTGFISFPVRSGGGMGNNPIRYLLIAVK